MYDILETFLRYRGDAVAVAAVSAAYAAMNLRKRRSAVAPAVPQRQGPEVDETATEDPLTGLSNRRVFQQRLDQVTRRFREGDRRPFAVLFIDFDRFKYINDIFGHATGDALLAESARRLVNGAHRYSQEEPTISASASRHGGDEFVMIVQGNDATTHAVRLAERLHSDLGVPCVLGGHEIQGRVSIGIRASELPFATADDVLHEADVAMYYAKAAGGGRTALFDPQMRQHAIKRLTFEFELRKALERNEFLVYYQPIVSLESGDLLGFEALMRWQHPERGLVSPADFIPTAEETGLIVPMGQWVLTAAAQQLAHWQKRFPHLCMSVNLSRKQLGQADLIKCVTSIAADAGVNRDTLALEVTESSVMEDPESASRILSSLREAGIPIYLDDFGTGYSSLSCLHKLPIDVLKIDRCFVLDAASRRDYAAVVQAIVTLAQNLNIRLVAEGIEDAGQLALLQAMSCQQGQGYFFSKPLPVDAVEAFIALNQTGRQAA